MYQTSTILQSFNEIEMYKSRWFKQNDQIINPIEINLSDYKKDRDAYIKRLNNIYQKNLDNSDVEGIFGKASFLDNNTIECNGDTYQAENILIACGGMPSKLDVPGNEHTINSDQFFDLKEVPKRTIVVGGGYIATELSQIISTFGSKVTILVRKCLLSTFDQELAGFQVNNLENSGITYQCGEVEKIDKNEDGSLKVTFQDGKIQEVDCVLVAIGRSPMLGPLKLENTDVEYDQSKIHTDEFDKTTADSIHAVGDCNGKVALTPVAIRAGRIVAERLFNNRPQLKMNYDNVPSVIFSNPPIGSVGLSEEKAVEKYGKDDLNIYKTTFGSKSLTYLNKNFEMKSSIPKRKIRL